METLAQIILNEKDIVKKMEIVYVLSNTLHFTLDKTSIFKTVLTKNFLDYAKAKKIKEISLSQEDEKYILSAILLANCKKDENPLKSGTLKTYAINSANYLYLMGFDEKICRIVEQINRYSSTNERLKESDILELSDQYGGLILDRSERVGFNFDEALVLLEHRNLKEYDNKYKDVYKTFIEDIEKEDTKQFFKYKPIAELIRLYRESEDTKQYIVNLSTNYLNQMEKIYCNMYDRENV